MSSLNHSQTSIRVPVESFSWIPVPVDIPSLEFYSIENSILMIFFATDRLFIAKGICTELYRNKNIEKSSYFLFGKIYSIECFE